MEVHPWEPPQAGSGDCISKGTPPDAPAPGKPSFQAGLPLCAAIGPSAPSPSRSEQGCSRRFGQGDRLFAVPDPDGHRPPILLKDLHLVAGRAFRTEGNLPLHLDGPHLLSVKNIHLLAEWKVKALFRGILICERAAMSGVQYRSNRRNRRRGSPATPAMARRGPASARRSPSRRRQLMRGERTIARVSSGA